MESNITFCNKGHQSLADFKDATRDVGDTLHIINVEKNVSGLLFHFFLPYLCLYSLGLVRVEVGWVYFDVLFFISEFYFLFLLIFILFSRACLCVLLVFSFTVFASMFVCLLICFVVLFRFYSIFLYLFIVYIMWLYFINFSLKVYVALKWDYHILFVYWLIVYVVFLKMYRNIVCIIQWNYN
jgi:hypothetical protein